MLKVDKQKLINTVLGNGLNAVSESGPCIKCAFIKASDIDLSEFVDAGWTNEDKELLTRAYWELAGYYKFNIAEVTGFTDRGYKELSLILDKYEQRLCSISNSDGYTQVDQEAGASLIKDLVAELEEHNLVEFIGESNNANRTSATAESEQKETISLGS